jgi:hypothetical protein
MQQFYADKQHFMIIIKQDYAQKYLIKCTELINLTHCIIKRVNT